MIKFVTDSPQGASFTSPLSSLLLYTNDGVAVLSYSSLANPAMSRKPVQEAIKYIEQYYNTDITLDIVSKEANLSSYYFSRLFIETTETNFITYLNHHHIRKAHRPVENTDKSITEIAYECGFKSIRNLNRTFKGFEGVTPHRVVIYKPSVINNKIIIKKI